MERWKVYILLAILVGCVLAVGVIESEGAEGPLVRVVEMRVAIIDHNTGSVMLMDEWGGLWRVVMPYYVTSTLRVTTPIMMCQQLAPDTGKPVSTFLCPSP